MYISKWELEEDGNYHQAVVSFKKSTTPFFKVRVIPKESDNMFHIMIRDYQTGTLFSSGMIGMLRNKENISYNLNQAKAHAEGLAQNCLEELTPSVK